VPINLSKILFTKLNKIKKNKLFIIALFATLAIFSCSKNDEIDTGYEEELIAQQLKFVDVQTRLNNNYKNESANKDVIIVIVRWDEWGRAKKECRG